MKYIIEVLGMGVSLLALGCSGAGVGPKLDLTTVPTGVSDGTRTENEAAPVADVALGAEESKFLALVNQHRVRIGAVALVAESHLTAASVWMSRDMAGRDTLSHVDSLGRDPFDRVRVFGFGAWGYAAENIAMGNSGAQETFEQWRSSSAHNTNMLGARYRRIGVGRARAPGGAWYWTTGVGA